MTESIEPRKPSLPSQYAAPLRLVAVGALRLISMGLSAMADAIEDKKETDA